MVAKQSFSEFLIKSLLLDKFEKTFWGKEYIRFGILSTLCSSLYEYSALLGVLYSKDWRTFISTFNIPIEEMEHLYEVSKDQIEKKLLPYAQDSTFFEIICKQFEKNDDRLSLLSERFTEALNEKITRKEALQLAAFNSLEGAFAGIIFPSVIKQIYDNGKAKQETVDKINEISKTEWNFDIKEKLGVSNFQYPTFEKQQYDVNIMFLEYAEENLPPNVFDKLLLATYDDTEENLYGNY